MFANELNCLGIGRSIYALSAAFRSDRIVIESEHFFRESVALAQAGLRVDRLRNQLLEA